MDIRMPTPKEAARILREVLAEKGVDLKHTQAIEVIARLSGYRNSHVMKTDASFKDPVALKANASEEFELRESSPKVRITAEQMQVLIERKDAGVQVSIFENAIGSGHPVYRGVFDKAGNLAGLSSAASADDPMCECQNCDWTGPESDLGPIRHFSQRVAPGEECPAGECPCCFALAHVIETGVAPVQWDDEDEDDESEDESEQWSETAFDEIPKDPQFVELKHRDFPNTAFERRKIMYISPDFRGLASRNADDVPDGEVALEYMGPRRSSEDAAVWVSVSFSVLLHEAKLDSQGWFHLPDGRIFRFARLLAN